MFFFCLRDSDKKTKTYHGVMVLQGSQVQFHSAKQIANSWILHSAAAAACAKQKNNDPYLFRLERWVMSGFRVCF